MRGPHRYGLRPSQLPALVMAVCAGVAVVACATTESTRPQTLSGFLDDYSILQPGEDDEAALVYRNPEARLGRYERVILAPVRIWYGVGTPLHDVPEEDLQTLANHLYWSMRRRLEDDYPIVEQPGPDVMRVELALTEAEGASVALDTISTAMPIRPYDAVKKLATGTHAFVGSAGIEGKISDARTDELLVAVVDRRAGTKNPSGVTETWSDVLEAFDLWSARLDERLAEARRLESER